MQQTPAAWWTDATGGAPWVSLVLLAGGLVLLAAVLWQWRARASARGTPRAPAPPPAGAPGSEDARSLVRELIAELDARADRLERLIHDADRVLERGAPRTRPPTSDPSPAPVTRDAVDPAMSRIYMLADEGLPTVEIARRLEQPTGKVELILALRGR